MDSAPGRTLSPWTDRAAAASRPPLARDLEVDVCIAGAGIAGLSVAYGLAGEGLSVAVLERDRIGCGETGQTTAHFVDALDDRYWRLEKLHGESGARLAAESHRAAIESVDAIVRAEGIDCGWELLDGFLFAPPGEDASELDRELDAARRAGVEGVELVARAPLPFDTGPALRFPRQGQNHPLRYLEGLARAVERRGGRIFEQTEVAGIDGDVVLTRDGCRVRARAIVVATNTPINDLALIHTKQVAFQTYVIGARLPRGSIARALCWDTLDPYHYVRLGSPPDDDLLIAGGEDHRTGQGDPGACWSRLESWTRARFPALEPTVYRWSGEVLEPNDGMAFIGRNPLTPGIYVVTGDSGNGMTHGALAGILLTDLVQGREHRWEELYDPSRKMLRAAAEFARENLVVAREYATWLAPADVARVEEIERGHGAVLRRGLKRVAVYVDESGAVHESSAACPHLGCVVSWNRAERSWDCPCHGSRFDALGALLHGPATVGLTAVEDRAPAERASADGAP